MVTTNLDVEKIVEIVTREVLLAIAEEGNKDNTARKNAPMASASTPALTGWGKWSAPGHLA